MYFDVNVEVVLHYTLNAMKLMKLTGFLRRYFVFTQLIPYMQDKKKLVQCGYDIKVQSKVVF